jgi:hypothetical protein
MENENKLCTAVGKIPIILVEHIHAPIFAVKQGSELFHCVTNTQCAKILNFEYSSQAGHRARN